MIRMSRVWGWWSATVSVKDKKINSPDSFPSLNRPAWGNILKLPSSHSADQALWLSVDLYHWQGLSACNQAVTPFTAARKALTFQRHLQNLLVEAEKHGKIKNLSGDKMRHYASLVFRREAKSGVLYFPGSPAWLGNPTYSNLQSLIGTLLNRSYRVQSDHTKTGISLNEGWHHIQRYCQFVIVNIFPPTSRGYDVMIKVAVNPVIIIAGPD